MGFCGAPPNGKLPAVVVGVGKLGILAGTNEGAEGGMLAGTKERYGIL